jgi:predicted O-methyltransferase YrrM
MIEYVPKIRDTPKIVNVVSAWGDIPTIIKDIIVTFNINPQTALEFGVEYGYSTSALANYFSKVIGIDTFEGDIYSYIKQNHHKMTENTLKNYKNIQLIQSSYQDYIKTNNSIYDLIHIDIVHTYNETYECGEWAVNHSKVVIFHDTISFDEVKKVCYDLSTKYGLEFYNYPDSHGLGILINNSI